MAPPPVNRGVLVTLTLGLAALALTYYAARWTQWDLVTRVVMALGFVFFLGVLVYADLLVRSPGRR